MLLLVGLAAWAWLCMCLLRRPSQLSDMWSRVCSCDVCLPVCLPFHSPVCPPPPSPLLVCLFAVQSDWLRDTKGQAALSYSSFFDSFFELADVWCPNIDAREYAEFLDALRLRLQVMVIIRKDGTQERRRGEVQEVTRAEKKRLDELASTTRRRRRRRKIARKPSRKESLGDATIVDYVAFDKSDVGPSDQVKFEWADVEGAWWGVVGLLWWLRSRAAKCCAHGSMRFVRFMSGWGRVGRCHSRCALYSVCVCVLCVLCGEHSQISRLHRRGGSGVCEHLDLGPPWTAADQTGLRWHLLRVLLHHYAPARLSLQPRHPWCPHALPCNHPEELFGVPSRVQRALCHPHGRRP